MKIVYVAPFGLGQKTTVWARILPIAKVAASHPDHPNAQVTIVIPPWDTPEDAGKSWTDDRVRLINVPLGGGLPFVIYRLLRAVVAAQPDIVHIIKPRAHAGIVQWLLWTWRAIWPRTSQHPKILLDIDDWEQAWNEISGHGPLLSWFLTWQEEWGIRHADGISAASLWLSKRAAEYAPDTPILYLPNGVTKPKLEGGASNINRSGQQSIHQILYLSRYVEVSAQWLASFWNALCTRVDSSKAGELQLIVAGGPLQLDRDKEFRRQFEAALNGVEAEDAASVSWLGLVDSEMISTLYESVSCAIFPADEVPLQQAKCSVRLATTLLYGLPVVASAVGQQSEYGANGAAHLVPAKLDSSKLAESASPSNGQSSSPQTVPEAFADAVFEVLVNPTEREAISSKAQAHLLEKFSWGTLGRGMVDFYEEILYRG